MERVVVHALEQVTPIIVRRSARIEECIAQWRLLQGDLVNYDIVFKDAYKKGEISPQALVESLTGKEKKLVAYHREVNISHDGIIEECEGAPTIDEILQNFASQNNLEASQYSLVLQRRPMRYVLEKKIKLAVRIDGATHTRYAHPDEEISLALRDERDLYDIHHESTHALIAPETTPSAIWGASDARAIYLKPKKREVKIAFQGEETVYSARGDVALRKIMNRWCTSNHMAARFWTSEGICAQESLKVADVSGPLKVEVISDKVVFTVIAHSDGTKTSSRIRGNSMDPIQRVLEQWCHFQDLSLDECRFEWKTFLLTGIEVPAFLGMEDEEEVHVFPTKVCTVASENADQTAKRPMPTTEAALVDPNPCNSGVKKVRNSGTPSHLGMKKRPMSVEAPAHLGMKKMTRNGDILKKVTRKNAIRKEKSVQSDNGSSSTSESEQDSRHVAQASTQSKDERVLETGKSIGRRAKRHSEHMTYEEWEKWDKKEEKRMKLLRKQPREQDDINLAIALSLSEIPAGTVNEKLPENR